MTPAEKTVLLAAKDIVEITQGGPLFVADLSKDHAKIGIFIRAVARLKQGTAEDYWRLK